MIVQCVHLITYSIICIHTLCCCFVYETCLWLLCSLDLRCVEQLLTNIIIIHALIADLSTSFIIAREDKEALLYTLCTWSRSMDKELLYIAVEPVIGVHSHAKWSAFMNRRRRPPITLLSNHNNNNLIGFRLSWERFLGGALMYLSDWSIIVRFSASTGKYFNEWMNDRRTKKANFKCWLYKS